MDADEYKDKAYSWVFQDSYGGDGICEQGDIIEMRLDLDSWKANFWLNDKEGKAYENIEKCGYIPCVHIYRAGDAVTMMT